MAMDEVSKYRLIGAAIWLALLVIIVPGWYSNPVDFQPGGKEIAKTEVSGPIVERAYTLPTTSQQVNPIKESSSGGTSEVTSNPLASQVSENNSESEQHKQEPNHEEWLVKVAAYKKLSNANHTLKKLDTQYKAWIKEFPASHTFSVRVGPYADKSEAERDKQKIDKALRTQSQIVRVK